jgi:hypothetical protein
MFKSLLSVVYTRCVAEQGKYDMFPKSNEAQIEYCPIRCVFTHWDDLR